MQQSKQTADDVSFEQQLICPFTLRSISDLPRENVAVIYKHNPSSDGSTAACGHLCTLSRLIPYLHDGSASSNATTNNSKTGFCPVCLSSPVGVVCDGISSSYLLQQTIDTTSNSDSKGENEGRVVSFRYGSVVYHLWVHSIVAKSYLGSSRSSKRNNALVRIGCVLGIDTQNGLKVIHKGKVIYPTKSKKETTIHDISEQILDISHSDNIRQRQKPSLIVMGSREQTLNDRWGNSSDQRSIVYTVVSRLTPCYLWSFARWSWQTSLATFGGVYLFVKSIFYPPQAISNR